MLKKLCPLIALSFALTHCGKDNSHKDPQPTPIAPSTQLTATSNQSILGTWLTCQLVEITEGVPFASMQAKLAFQANGSQQLTFTPFVDKNCEESLTEQHRAAAIAKVEAYVTSFGGTWEESDKAEFVKNLSPQTFKGTFKAGLPDAAGVGTLDVANENEGGVELMFVTYKIAGDELAITDSCSADDVAEELCTAVVGTSAETRATDFTDALVLKKQK